MNKLTFCISLTLILGCTKPEVPQDTVTIIQHGVWRDNVTEEITIPTNTIQYIIQEYDPRAAINPFYMVVTDDDCFFVTEASAGNILGIFTFSMLPSEKHADNFVYTQLIEPDLPQKGCWINKDKVKSIDYIDDACLPFDEPKAYYVSIGTSTLRVSSNLK